MGQLAKKKKKLFGSFIGEVVSEVTGQAVTLLNTSASPSPGFFRAGVVFEKGDIPSGNILTASVGGTSIRTAMMNVNTHSDGSLRYCILVGELNSEVPASSSVTVNISSQTGAQSTSGLDPFTLISGLTDDLTIDVTSHTGSSSGALADRTYSLQTAAAVTTRREIVSDTDVCIRVRVWGHPTGEKHLMGLHYVDLWLDDLGSLEAVEWTPVLSQHWWIDDPFGDGAQTKEERGYSYDVKNGTTSLTSGTAVVHGYYCRAVFLQDQDDAQCGKPFWIDLGTAQPTLVLQYSLDSKKAMMKAGYLPPMKQGVTYDSSSFTNDHEITGVHSGTDSTNHRRAINGTGGFNGRGVITNLDTIALTEQTADAWRVARISAQAACHAGMHIRDHRTLAGDASGKIFPSKMQGLGAQSYTDLGSEIILVSGSGGELNDVSPNGTSGAFNSWDAAHHVSYGYFMAMTEGYDHLMDATLSQFDFLCHGTGKIGANLNYNPFAINPRRLWDVDDRPAIVDEFYGVNYLHFRQERDPFNCQLAIDHAWCVLPDASPEVPLLENFLDNCDTYLQESIAEFGTSQTDHGSLWTRNPPRAKAWMANLCALAFCRAGLLHDGVYTNMDDARDRFFKWASLLLDEGRHYASESDEYLRHDPVNTAGTFEDYLAPADIYTYQQVTDITSNTLTMNHREGLHVVDNDTVIPFDDLAEGGDAIPAALTEGTVYHVINATPDVGGLLTTFQLSATQGGSAITLTDTTTILTLGVKRAVDLTAVQGTGSTYIAADDSFLNIYVSAAEYMYGIGSSLVGSSEISDLRTFAAPSSPDNDSFSSWNINGDLIL